MSSVKVPECVRWHVVVLRRCGFWSWRGGGRRGALHAAYRGGALTLTSLYLAQEVAWAWGARRDPDRLAAVMFLLLCHVTSLVKQLVLHARRTRLDELLATLDDPLYRPQNETQVRLVAEADAGAVRLARVYSGCAALTCALWATREGVRRVYGARAQLPFYVPGEYARSHAAFCAVLAYSYYVTTLVAVANTTMDAFIASVLGHCHTQLRILRMNFEDLPERAAALLLREPSRSFDDAFKKLFVDCLKHYEKITKTAQMLQEIFGSAILIQFSIGGWILCMAAYQIVKLEVVSVEFASMLLFMWCILTELFLYCYYGSQVREESALVTDAVYSARWYVLPLRWQRALRPVLERAKRPLSPVAGRVVPLSLQTFVKIIKSSYTFYAVLRQTK